MAKRKNMNAIISIAVQARLKKTAARDSQKIWCVVERAITKELDCMDKQHEQFAKFQRTMRNA